jgi:hypothetical protein
MGKKLASAKLTTASHHGAFGRTDNASTRWYRLWSIGEILNGRPCL